MSSKSKHKTALNTTNATPNELPIASDAQAELARQYLRTVVSLLIRTVAVALLAALLVAQIPVFRQVRWLIDMISGVLVLWPFFTRIGRIYARRIHLGKQYVEREQWDSAVQILAPVEGWRSRFFDVTGEGTYWRATALYSLKQYEDARLLFTSLAMVSSIWGQKAQKRLEEWEEGKVTV